MKYNNIVLIDDDPDDQELFIQAVKTLQQTSDCMVFSSAIKAMEFLNQSASKPDLMFLDLNMPVMNGEEFLVRIKKTNDLKDIPVIIYSTSAHKRTIELMKSLGAIEFITKPDKYSDLLALLKPILH